MICESYRRTNERRRGPAVIHPLPYTMILAADGVVRNSTSRVLLVINDLLGMYYIPLSLSSP